MRKYFPVIRTIYVTYKGMMYRCYNPKDPAYKYYGAKGITVCDDWKNDYQVFLNWSLANGWSSELELDKDISNGNIYSPETCKWVTHKENMLNLASFKVHEYNGQLLTISKISQLTGVLRSALNDRMKRGYSLNESIEQGKSKSKSASTSYYDYNGERLSLRMVCKKYNFRYSLIRFRVNDKGMKLEDAIKTKSCMTSKYDNL